MMALREAETTAGEVEGDDEDEASTFFLQSCSSDEELLFCLSNDIPFCFTPGYCDASLSWCLEFSSTRMVRQLTRAVQFSGFPDVGGRTWFRTVYSLSLEGTALTDEMVAVLAKVLEDPHSSIRRLLLSYNNITGQGCESLATALYHNHRLETLAIGWNFLSDRGMLALSKSLTHNTTLRRLDIRSNGICFDGASALRATLNSNRTLIEAVVTYNQIPRSLLVQIGSLLERNRTEGP